MFSFGFGEMVLIAAIALIAIGPKQLPEVARTVGRLLNELKRATGDLSRTVMEARDSTNEALTSVLEPKPRPATQDHHHDQDHDHDHDHEQMQLELTETADSHKTES